MLIKTSVTEVQVYRAGATVMRTGKAPLTAGRNVLYIAGMTQSADSGSFRLKFPGKVRAINLQVVGIDDLKEDVTKESEKVKKEIADLEYQIETNRLMLKLRQQNANCSGRKNVTLEEQERMMEALPEQLLSIHREIDRLEEEKKKLEEKLEDIEKDEDQPVILAELQAEEAGEVPFILQYQEQASFWAPKYEVQYTDDRSPLEVRMKAEIVQRSGEDWKQVKVSLYTGNPSASNEIPAMSSLQLTLVEPPKLRTRAKGVGMMAMRAAEDGCAIDEECVEDAAFGAAPSAMMMNSLKMEAAEMSEEETMKAFLLPNARDIISDTEGNIADLQSFTVKANYHVLTIPSVDTHSYLTAEIKAADWPLPPADAAIYLGDTFAGNVYVDPTQDTDLLTLSLGQDERLTVTRTEKPKQRQDAFLKNERREVSATEIRIVNTSSEAVKVLVKDQVPVSTDKAIEVEVANISDGIRDEESGEVCWELSAEPDTPISLQIEYKVSWPKDKQLHTRRTAMRTKHRFCPNCGCVVTGKFCPECGSAVPANEK
jgi:uncharacterized protein (TIGR02231 family)